MNLYQIPSAGQRYRVFHTQTGKTVRNDVPGIQAARLLANLNLVERERGKPQAFAIEPARS